MAADAPERFAGQDERPAAHRLDDAPFFVERLEVERGAGGRVETGASVLFDVNGSEHVFHVPSAVADRDGRGNSTVVFIVGEGRRGCAIFEPDDAQLFDRSARDAL